VAVIGTAHVEIRAITDKINTDVRKALQANVKEFENAGKQYGQAMERGLKNNGGLAGVAPELNTADAEKSGREYSRMLARGLQDNNATFVNAGKKVSDSFARGLNNNSDGFSPKINTTAFDNAAREINRSTRTVEQNVQQSTNRISNFFSRAGANSAQGFKLQFGKGNISAYLKRIFYQILFAVPAVGALVGALSSLVSGLFAVASAVAPAANALAILPGLAAAAATGIIAAVVAFKGIGAAYKAGTAAATGSGGAMSRAAKGAAQAVENSKERIAQAQRDLRDAYEDAAESISDAYQRIIDSTRAYRDAVEGAAEDIQSAQEAVYKANVAVRDAEEQSLDKVIGAQQELLNAQGRLDAATKRVLTTQKAVNEARIRAAEIIRDTQFAAEGAAISEGKAAIALERAREKLAEVSELPPNHRLRKEAELNYRQAQLDLEMAKRDNVDAAKVATETAKKGVENSDVVAEAKQAEVDANNEVVNAQNEVANASVELARAQRDAIEDVNEALQDQKDAYAELKKARRDGKESIADAAAELKDARADLKFVKRDAKEAIQDAKNALAKAIQGNKDALAGMGAAAGGGVNQFANAMKKLSPEAQAFVKYLISIRDEFVKVRNAAGEELFPKLTTALQTIVGNGFLGLLADGLRIAGGAMGDVAIQIANLTSDPFFRGNFSSVMQANAGVITGLGGTLTNLINLFFAVAKAAEPVTQEFVNWMESVTGGWLKSAQDDMGGLSEKISKGAEVAKQLGRIFRLIWENLGLVRDAAEESGQSLLDSFEDALKKLKEFLSTPEQNQAMKKYFEGVADNVRKLGDLFNALSVEFIKLGDDPAIGTISDKLTAAMPNLGETLSKSLETVGPAMADLLVEVLEIFEALAANGGLKAFVDTLLFAVRAINDSPLGDVVVAFAKIYGTYKALSLLVQVSHITKLYGAFMAGAGATKAFISGLRGVAAGTTAANARMNLFALRVRAAVIGLKNFVRQSAITIANLARQAAAWAVATAQTVLHTAATKIASAATKVGAAVQAAFNAVMALNPITLIVLAVAALVAGLVLFFTKTKIGRKIWKAFTDALVKAWDGIKKGFKTAWDAIQKGFDWVKKNWPTLLAIITGPIGIAVLLITKNWDKIKKGASAAKEWIVEAFDKLVTFFKTMPGKVWDALKTMWDKVKTAATTAKDWIADKLEAVVTFAKGIPTKFWNAIKTIFNLYKEAATTAYNWVKDKLLAVVTFAGTIPGKFWNAIKTMWNSFKEAATGAGTWVKEKLNGVVDWAKGFGSRFWTALKNMWTSFKEAATTAGGWVREKLNSLIEWARGVPGRFASAVSGLWTSFKEKATDAKNWVSDKMTNVINTVKGLPKRIATAASGMWDGIKDAFKSAINWIIDKWNGLQFKIGGAKVLGKTIPSVTLGTPDIPRLALGGTVQATPGGVNAIIAEAGHDERVTPLDSDGMSAGERAINETMREFARAPRGVTINVYGAPGMDITALARQVSRELAFIS
jgi:phage-related protein